jgi:predicted esterase YcpF (UPF0227 family)
MSNLMVVYFHGYGSSPIGNKVMQLRQELNVPVYAFPAAVDPEGAEREVGYNIDMVLMDNLHAPVNMLFVGTFLGGWLASKMSAVYNVPAIIINPPASPCASLRKDGVPEDICAKYDDLVVSDKNAYFFAQNDGVIDHSNLLAQLRDHPNVFIDPEADHWFTGDPFGRVIEYIKKNIVNFSKISYDPI